MQLPENPNEALVDTPLFETAQQALSDLQDGQVIKLNLRFGEDRPTRAMGVVRQGGRWLAWESDAGHNRATREVSSDEVIAALLWDFRLEQQARRRNAPYVNVGRAAAAALRDLKE
jgi:hypothetical protein